MVPCKWYKFITYERGSPSDTSVVHEHVDATEHFFDPLERSYDLLFVAQVHVQRVKAGRFDFVFEFLYTNTMQCFFIGLHEKKIKKNLNTFEKWYNSIKRA